MPAWGGQTYTSPVGAGGSLVPLSSWGSVGASLKSALYIHTTALPVSRFLHQLLLTGQDRAVI